MDMLKTERLLIRNFRSDEWRVLQALVLQYQTTRSAQFETPWPSNDEEIKQLTHWFSTSDYYLAICLQENDTLIGIVSIEARTEQGKNIRNFNYVFHPDYYGHGYASEACNEILRYLFDQLAVDGISNITHPNNHLSVRFLSKLGLFQIRPGEFSLSRRQWQTLVAEKNETNS